MSNLRFLLRLHNRAWDAVNRAEGSAPAADAGGAQEAGSDSDSDVELLGLRTRLVERAAEGGRLAKSIPGPTLEQSARFENQAISRAWQEFLRESFGDPGPVNHDTGSSSGSLEKTTNHLLAQICDPLDTQPQMPPLEAAGAFGDVVRLARLGSS
jgi:hypothetical protein